jgi:hypothetical protein
MSQIKNLFTGVYQHNLWGWGESKSGIGSSLLYTESLRKNLLEFIKQNKILKIFDCSCGDWNWMKEIKDCFVDYTGNDIVEELINSNNKKFSSEKIKFICGDMIENLSSFDDNYFDLIICRHTLEHLPSGYVEIALKIISKKSKYGFITNSSLENNIELDEFNGTRGRGINLNLPPYSDILKKRISIIYDTSGDGVGIDKTKLDNSMYVFEF